VPRSRDDQIRHTVSLKSDLNERMSARIKEGGFSSVSEYVRHAIREDLSRTERARLESTLLEGIGDEHYGEVTGETFAALRETVRKARDTSTGRK
jgi:antitoxin ParD1/3/4